jgi:aspartate aminotransferase
MAAAARSLQTSGSRAMSAWVGVPMAPPDAIFGVSERFNKDKDPNRINLSVGAYRDEHGKVSLKRIATHAYIYCTF